MCKATYTVTAVTTTTTRRAATDGAAVAVDDIEATTVAESGGVGMPRVWGRRRCADSGPASSTAESCTVSVGGSLRTYRWPPPTTVPTRTTMTTTTTTTSSLMTCHRHRRCGAGGATEATAVGSVIERPLLLQLLLR